MEQGNLFGTPKRRPPQPSTVEGDICEGNHGGNPYSQIAFEGVKQKIGKLHKRILPWLELNPSTCEETELALGIYRSTCSARFSELITQRLLTQVGTRPTRSGSPAAVWTTRFKGYAEHEATKVIAFKNEANRIPFWGAFIVWLMLDRLKPPGWVAGAVWTVYGVIALACIISFFTQVEVDIFDEEEAAKRRTVTLASGASN